MNFWEFFDRNPIKTILIVLFICMTISDVARNLG